MTQWVVCQPAGIDATQRSAGVPCVDPAHPSDIAATQPAPCLPVIFARSSACLDRDSARTAVAGCQVGTSPRADRSPLRMAQCDQRQRCAGCPASLHHRRVCLDRCTTRTTDRLAQTASQTFAKCDHTRGLCVASSLAIAFSSRVVRSSWVPLPYSLDKECATSHQRLRRR